MLMIISLQSIKVSIKTWRENFFKKWMNVNIKKEYLCFIRKQRTNRLTKSGGNKGSLTLICIISTNWHSDIENYNWLNSQARWMGIKRKWVNMLKIGNLSSLFQNNFFSKTQQKQTISLQNVSTELVALICKVFLFCSVWYNYIIRKNVENLSLQ